MAVPIHTVYTVGAGLPIIGGRWPAGRLAGNMDLAALLAVGDMGSNASSLIGDVMLAAAVATGAMQGVPAWLTSMTTRTWMQVPLGNTLASIDPEDSPLYNPNYPAAAPWHGAGGQPMVLDAWCSLVPFRDRWILIAGPGGGHGDYAANEWYLLDLMSSNPVWVMVRPPSGALGQPAVANYADGQEATGLYSDGRIRAMHNYNAIAHIPGTDEIFVSVVAAPYYNPVQTAQKSWTLNCATGAQTLASDFSALTQVQGSGEGGCCYDPVRHCMWHVRNGGFGSRMMKTDLATGVTTAHGIDDTWVGGSSRFVYIPDKDCVVNFTGVGPGYCLWNPATETWTRNPPAPTGSKSSGLAALGGAVGYDWVPELGAIGCWNNSSATAEITLLTPPSSGSVYTQSWVHSVLANDPSNSVTPTGIPGGGGGNANVHGKFGYLPAMKCFYLQTTFASPLLVYKVANL